MTTSILFSYTMTQSNITADYLGYCFYILQPIQTPLLTTLYIVVLYYWPSKPHYWLLGILCSYTMTHPKPTADYIALLYCDLFKPYYWLLGILCSYTMSYTNPTDDYLVYYIMLLYYKLPKPYWWLLGILFSYNLGYPNPRPTTDYLVYCATLTLLLYILHSYTMVYPKKLLLAKLCSYNTTHPNPIYCTLTLWPIKPLRLTTLYICTLTLWPIKPLWLTTLYIMHLHYGWSNLYYWLLCIILYSYMVVHQTITTDYFVYCALTLWPIKPLLWTTWYIVHLHYDPSNLYYWLLCILCTYTMVHQTFTTDYIAYIMLSYFILFSIIMLLYYNPP